MEMFQRVRVVLCPFLHIRKHFTRRSYIRVIFPEGFRFEPQRQLCVFECGGEVTLLNQNRSRELVYLPDAGCSSELEFLGSEESIIEGIKSTVVVSHLCVHISRARAYTHHQSLVIRINNSRKGSRRVIQRDGAIEMSGFSLTSSEIDHTGNHRMRPFQAELSQNSQGAIDAACSLVIISPLPEYISKEHEDICGEG